jgi:hypothetical protein
MDWVPLNGTDVANLAGKWVTACDPIIIVVLGALFVPLVVFMLVRVLREVGHVGEGSVTWGFSGGGGFGRAAGNVAGWGATYGAAYAGGPGRSGFDASLDEYDAQLGAIGAEFASVMNEEYSVFADTDLYHVFRELADGEGVGAVSEIRHVEAAHYGEGDG